MGSSLLFHGSLLALHLLHHPHKADGVSHLFVHSANRNQFNFRTLPSLADLTAIPADPKNGLKLGVGAAGFREPAV